jgi:hypothetical protein
LVRIILADFDRKLAGIFFGCVFCDRQGGAVTLARHYCAFEITDKEDLITINVNIKIIKR